MRSGAVEGAAAVSQRREREREEEEGCCPGVCAAVKRGEGGGEPGGKTEWGRKKREMGAGRRGERRRGGNIGCLLAAIR